MITIPLIVEPMRQLIIKLTNLVPEENDKFKMIQKTWKYLQFLQLFLKIADFKNLNNLLLHLEAIH